MPIALTPKSGYCLSTLSQNSSGVCEPQSQCGVGRHVNELVLFCRAESSWNWCIERISHPVILGIVFREVLFKEFHQ